MGALTMDNAANYLASSALFPLLVIPVAILMSIIYQRMQNSHVPRVLDPTGLSLLLGSMRNASARYFPFWWASLHKKYGETFVIGSLTASTSYSTISRQNIKTFLSTSFNSWALGNLRNQAFKPLLGNGIFTQDGGAWAHSRKLLRPQFQRRELEGLGSIHEHIRRFLEFIPDGQVVDLQPLLYRLTCMIFPLLSSTLMSFLSTSLSFC